MKKTLLLAGVASLLFAHNAQADCALNIKPVVGVDYVYSQIDLDDGMDEFVENKFNAFALSAGIKINNSFGIEAFYQQSEKAKKSKNFFSYPYVYSLKTQLQYKAYGLDLVAYAPVNSNFDVIGTVGIAYYDAELNVGWLSDSEKEVGGRLGIGAQYNLNEHVSLRLMGRYNYTGIENAENMFDVTAGARLYF